MIEKFVREKVESIEYWRELNLGCTITHNPWPNDRGQYPVSSLDESFIRDQLRTDGYFVFDPIVPAEMLSRLQTCILNVVSAGHATTYALLYDQFYEVFARIGSLLEIILGPEYLLVPDEFEAYYIPTADEYSGTGPHRDSLQPVADSGLDGVPQLLNVWIPITDATTLNSCMHVIPAHRDVCYNLSGPVDLESSRPDSFNLQDVRALPAPAGSVLCWAPQLLHWGGRSSRFAESPRLSFAAYFQSASKSHFHPTAMPLYQPIPFDYRLYLAEKVWRDPSGINRPPFNPS